VSLLLIPLILAFLLALPFTMAWLEGPKKAPTHRATSRRPTPRWPSRAF